MPALASLARAIAPDRDWFWLLRKTRAAWNLLTHLMATALLSLSKRLKRTIFWLSMILGSVGLQYALRHSDQIESFQPSSIHHFNSGKLPFPEDAIMWIAFWRRKSFILLVDRTLDKPLPDS